VVAVAEIDAAQVMNTYPIHNREGKLFAFEIEHVYIGTRKIAALLRSIPGLSPQ
jgi:hypothetical protein